MRHFAADGFPGLDWNSLYFIGYTGAGNVGNDTSVYTRISEYKVDAGVGFESAISFRKYRAFLGALVAKTVVNGIGSPRLLITLKSYR